MRRMNEPIPIPKPLGNRRGSALILVLLLSLILSATAIVALRDVARSVQNSAVFRTRVQAQQTSNAVVQVYTARTGNKADAVITAIEESMYGKEGTGATDPTGVFGGGHDTTSSLSFEERRRAQAVMGGHVEFTNTELAALLGTPPAGETGMFTDSAGSARSFESRRQSQWRVIVRDLMEGPKAEGYSQEYCFKKAVVGAEALIGQPDDDWTGPNNVALTRHTQDALIGPSMKCGYHGN